MTRPTERTYRAVWSEDDQQYVATVNDYPSLSALADDPTNATLALIRIVAACDADIAAERTTGGPS